MKESRQQLRAKLFKSAFAQVKEKHGSGQYSWAEGVTRRSARRIARSIAKQIFNEKEK